MKAVSPALAELTNLINAAKWHRDNCHESCNVALYTLGHTASRLVPLVWPEEKAEAEKLFKDMNWIV